MTAEDPIFQITVRGENETAAFAKRVSEYLKVGDVLSLEGTLGAGKTAFARSLIRALVGSETEVPSPTFNLLLTYQADIGPIYHYDMYRLDDPEEVWELDIEEALEYGITLIEWMSNLEDLAPENVLTVKLDILEEGARQISLIGGSDWAERLQGLKG